MEESSSHEEVHESKINVSFPGTKTSNPYIDKQTIFVGNLKKTTTQDDLEQFFKVCGPVSRIRILKDKHTGAPRGKAFVEFEEEESVEPATKLDGEELNGATIKVNRGAADKPGQEKRTLNNRSIYVGKLNFKTTEETVMKVFKKFGKVLEVRLPVFKDSNKKRGFAIVEYKSEGSVERAIKITQGEVELDGWKPKVQAIQDNREPEVRKKAKSRKTLKLKRKSQGYKESHAKKTRM